MFTECIERIPFVKIGPVNRLHALQRYISGSLSRQWKVSFCLVILLLFVFKLKIIM